MRDDDHHAEQQRDRIEVDGTVGILQTQRADRDHRRAAQKGDSGAIEAQAGDPADRDAAIGEDQNRQSGAARKGHFAALSAPIGSLNARIARGFNQGRLAEGSRLLARYFVALPRFGRSSLAP
jgi:hypothetical protein